MKLLFVRRLSRKERDFIYANLDDKVIGKKCLVLALSYEGAEVRELARRINLHPEWVRRIIREFNKHGIKSLLKSRGRPGKVNEKVEKIILRLAVKNPRKLGFVFSNWSLHKLRWYLEKKYGIKLNHETIRKILLKHGLRFRRAKTKLFSQDPCYEAKKCRIQRLLTKPNCIILFEDEKCLVAKAFSGYEWCFKARLIPRNQRIKGKCYLFLFYGPHDKRVYRFYFDKAGRKNFIKTVEEISKRTREKVYLILDNSAIHKLKREEIPANIEFIFLPTYSPELNLVEPIFSSIQRELLWNQKFKNIQEVIQRVDEWLKNKYNLINRQINTNF